MHRRSQALEKPPTLQELDNGEATCPAEAYCVSTLESESKIFFLLPTSLENLLIKFNIITRKGKAFKRPRFIFTDQSIRIHMELKNQKLLLSDL